MIRVFLDPIIDGFLGEIFNTKQSMDNEMNNNNSVIEIENIALPE